MQDRLRELRRFVRGWKGPWHVSKTIATGVGLTNPWLAAQGMLSLKTLWAELTPLRGTAVCGPACTVVWGGRPDRDVLTRILAFMVALTLCFVAHALVELRVLYVNSRCLQHPACGTERRGIQVGGKCRTVRMRPNPRNT